MIVIRVVKFFSRWTHFPLHFGISVYLRERNIKQDLKFKNERSTRSKRCVLDLMTTLEDINLIPNQPFHSVIEGTTQIGRVQGQLFKHIGSYM